MLDVGICGTDNEIAPGTPVKRDYVLKNQVVFGTVNASLQSFVRFHRRSGRVSERWPAALPLAHHAAISYRAGG